MKPEAVWKYSAIVGKAVVTMVCVQVSKRAYEMFRATHNVQSCKKDSQLQLI